MIGPIIQAARCGCRARVRQRGCLAPVPPEDRPESRSLPGSAPVLAPNHRSAGNSRRDLFI